MLANSTYLVSVTALFSLSATDRLATVTDTDVADARGACFLIIFGMRGALYGI